MPPNPFLVPPPASPPLASLDDATALGLLVPMAVFLFCFGWCCTAVTCYSTRSKLANCGDSYDSSGAFQIGDCNQVFLLPLTGCCLLVFTIPALTLGTSAMLLGAAGTSMVVVAWISVGCFGGCIVLSCVLQCAAGDFGCNGGCKCVVTRSNDELTESDFGILPMFCGLLDGHLVCCCCPQVSAQRASARREARRERERASVGAAGDALRQELQQRGLTLYEKVAYLQGWPGQGWLTYCLQGTWIPGLPTGQASPTMPSS